MLLGRRLGKVIRVFFFCGGPSFFCG